MGKRILLMTQWFDPEPTFKGLVFAKALAKQGFEVEVVTGFPNYPGGKLYPGYRLRWRQKEVIDGMAAVTRLWLYPSHDRSVAHSGDCDQLIRRIATTCSDRSRPAWCGAERPR